MEPEKIVVALRCRPLIEKETREGCQACLQTIPGKPQIIFGKDRAFTYDFAFGPSDPQVEVYTKACKKLVHSIFKGYNATILAYGQTGSGKTFTMGGGYEASLSGCEDDMGVIPRVLRDIFQHIQEKDNVQFAVRVSYLEIYNEHLKDLLAQEPQKKSLTIREEKQGSIKIHGLKEVRVTNLDETLTFWNKGSQGRATGATAMNNTSSRSHTVFTLHIDQTKEDRTDCCKVKFHLVDLAGSERCKRTMAQGKRFTEGVNINKGLLSLGNVISALGDEAPKRTHIPYRDSKLTRILQDSLGGNSYTLLIACVSPAYSNFEETLNTLRYADRARKIKNKPIINRDTQAAEIMQLKTLQLQGQIQQGSVSLSTIKPESIDKHKTDTQEYSHDGRCKLSELVLKLEINNHKLNKILHLIKDCVGTDLELLSPTSTQAYDRLQKIADAVKLLDTEAMTAFND